MSSFARLPWRPYEAEIIPVKSTWEWIKHVYNMWIPNVKYESVWVFIVCVTMPPCGASLAKALGQSYHLATLKSTGEH